MKKTNRALSVFLTLVLALSLLPWAATSARAASSGTCGDGLTWNLDNNGNLTVSGSGYMTSYKIDGYTGDEPVSPFHALKAQIKTVTINSGVKSIGKYAFATCDQITSVTIASSVTNVNNSAFNGCSSLQYVTFAAGEGSSEYAYFGQYAFAKCTSLKTISLPQGTTSIAPMMFSGCTALQSISLPAKVTYIEAQGFFGCTALSNVVLPETLTGIGFGAFAGCESLTSFTIPRDLTTLGNSVFQDCASLATIAVTPGNNTFCVDDNVLYDIDKTKAILCPCKKESVTLPDTVTAIGGGAFAGCALLTEIKLPAGVEKIESRAFEGCAGLTAFEIPAGVTELGSNAFQYCTSLESVTMPESLETLNAYTFNGCTSLPTVELPANVKKIATGAFQDCTSLTGLVLPDGVENIENYVFKGCTSLKEIVLPDGLNYLNIDTFANCTSLESVTLPAGAFMVSEAFKGCTGVKTLTVNGTGEMAWTAGIFPEKAKITTVRVNEGVTAVSKNAFQGCTGLTEVHLPMSLTEVKDGAFDGCAALADVYYRGARSMWGTSLTIGADNAPLTDAARHYLPGLTADMGDGAVSYRVINAQGALLIAARYDAGQLTGVKLVTVDSDDKNSALAVSGTGDDYRLMLVDAETFAPLCEAWASEKAV